MGWFGNMRTALSARAPLHRAALSAVLAIGTIGLASSGSGCSSGTGDTTGPCGGAATCQVRLTVLHTSDIHSRLLPYDLLVTQVDGDLGLGTTGTLSNVG